MKQFTIIAALSAAIILSAWAGAPITDIKISGTASQVASGTLTIGNGAALVSATGATVNFSAGTVTFGTAQIPAAAVATSGGTFVGDSGSGGAAGFVPAPGSGDAAAGKVLGAGGGWITPYAPQTANKIFAGPSATGTAAPAFRALVTADLPAIAVSGLSDVAVSSPGNNDVLAWSSTAGKWVNSSSVGGGLSDPTTTKGDLMARSSSNVVRLPVGTDGQILIADSSASAGVRWGTRDSVHVRNSAGISVTSASNTILTFNTEDWDSGNLHSTSSNTGRLTAQRDGVYLIAANVSFDVSDQGTLRVASIRLNGSQRIASNAIPALSGTGSAAHINVTALQRLTTGDYVEVSVYQDTGASLAIIVNEQRSPIFSMAQISD